MFYEDNIVITQVIFRSNSNLEMLIFVAGGKPEDLEKNSHSKGENQ
jgi:hypothetical protein